MPAVVVVTVAVVVTQCHTVHTVVLANAVLTNTVVPQVTTFAHHTPRVVTTPAMSSPHSPCRPITQPMSAQHSAHVVTTQLVSLSQKSSQGSLRTPS